MVRQLFPTRQEGVVSHASTPRPHPGSRQSSSPVDPAEYPARAARQWIAPRAARQLLASESRRVRQGGSPEDPAKYFARAAPARAARQWSPPGILPQQLASGSRRELLAGSCPVYIPPELLASGSRRVRQGGKYFARAAPARAVLIRAAPQWIPPRSISEKLESALPVDPAENPPEQPSSGSRQPKVK